VHDLVLRQAQDEVDFIGCRFGCNALAILLILSLSKDEENARHLNIDTP
jgi:hypothetical protein